MRVLQYTHRWLELSAGFVYAHVTTSRHPNIVVVRDHFENRDAYPLRRVINLASIRDRSRLNLSNATMLRAIGTATRAQLCHVHFAYAAPDALRLTRQRRIPFVLSLHGHDASAWPREHPEDFGPLAGGVSAVIVPSLFLADQAKQLGFPEDRIHVIPSGIDTEWFTPDPDTTADTAEVLFVGRLVEKKGLDVLLRAWTRVAAAVPDAGLRIIGSGPLLPLVTSPDLDRVVYEPPDPRRRSAQVRDAIRAAAVVVTPSRTAADGDTESLLLVNLEAQACGRPVVTTRLGGIPEFVRDGETALVVPEADPGELTDALITLLRDRDLASRLGHAGVAWAQSFDVRRCTAEVDDLYDRLLRRQ